MSNDRPRFSVDKPRIAFRPEVPMFGKSDEADRELEKRLLANIHKQQAEAKASSKLPSLHPESPTSAGSVKKSPGMVSSSSSGTINLVKGSPQHPPSTGNSQIAKKNIKETPAGSQANLLTQQNSSQHPLLTKPRIGSVKAVTENENKKNNNTQQEGNQKIQEKKNIRPSSNQNKIKPPSPVPPQTAINVQNNQIKKSSSPLPAPPATADTKNEGVINKKKFDMNEYLSGLQSSSSGLDSTLDGHSELFQSLFEASRDTRPSASSSQQTQTAVPLRAQKENELDSQLVSSMARRLQRVEAESRKMRIELDIKKEECQKLKSERDTLHSQINDSNYLFEIKDQNNRLLSQIEDMKLFLADYGMVWVGDRNQSLSSSNSQTSISSYNSQISSSPHKQNKYNDYYNGNGIETSSGDNNEDKRIQAKKEQIWDWGKGGRNAWANDKGKVQANYKRVQQKVMEYEKQVKKQKEIEQEKEIKRLKELEKEKQQEKEREKQQEKKKDKDKDKVFSSPYDNISSSNEQSTTSPNKERNLYSSFTIRRQRQDEQDELEWSMKMGKKLKGYKLGGDPNKCNLVQGEGRRMKQDGWKSEEDKLKKKELRSESQTPQLPFVPKHSYTISGKFNGEDNADQLKLQPPEEFFYYMNKSSASSGSGNSGLITNQQDQGQVKQVQYPFPINTLIVSLESLSYQAGEGKAKIVTKEDGSHVLRFPDPVPITLFQDGILLFSGPFRSLKDKKTIAFLQDVHDGYFPWELHERFPEGCTFSIKDQTNIDWATHVRNQEKGINSNVSSFSALNTKGKSIGSSDLGRKADLFLSRVSKVKIVDGEIVNTRDEIRQLLEQQKKGISKQQQSNYGIELIKENQKSINNLISWPLLRMDHKQQGKKQDTNKNEMKQQNKIKSLSSTIPASEQQQQEKSKQEQFIRLAPTQIAMDTFKQLTKGQKQSQETPQSMKDFIDKVMISKQAVPIIMRIPDDSQPILLCLQKSDTLKDISDYTLKSSKAPVTAVVSGKKQTDGSLKNEKQIQLYFPALGQIFDTNDQKTAQMAIGNCSISPLSVVVIQFM